MQFHYRTESLVSVERWKRRCRFAVYKHIGESELDVPKTEDLQLIVGVYRHALSSDGWVVVDKRPFKTDEDPYLPPQCVPAGLVDSDFL
jgi:hypothetical protein